jgi:hypothetical protein
MAGPLQTRAFGPFLRGAIDTANASDPGAVAGALKNAKGLVYSGARKLTARGGTRVVMTLKDDQGSPADVTAVCALVTFGDWALAVAHSTTTQKVYLYRLAPDLTGWYNASGVLQSNTSASPVGVLWSSIPNPPDVTVAEGLGVAYIAHNGAADGTTLAWPTKVYEPSPAARTVTSITRSGATATLTAAAAHGLANGDSMTVAGAGQTEYNITATITQTSTTAFTYAVAGTPATPATGTITYTPAAIRTLASDLDGSGTNEALYALGVVSFQQHLWIWGVGTGTSATNHYRPELLRFGQPNFTLPLLAGDSITVGDRVRSQREKVVGAIVAGEALFFGSPFALTRVTGYGRASWFRQVLDKSFGFPGPKCMCVRGDTLYYWSSAGPMRCAAGGAPERLHQRVTAAVSSVINPETVVASYDEASDLVLFVYNAGNGVRTWAGYDAERDVWVGPDDDLGLAVRHMAAIAPVYASAAAATAPGAPSSGPTGAPTTPSTSDIGTSVATAHWTTGDPGAETSVEYRRQVDTAWTVANVVPAGVTSFQISGLASGVQYEWRVAHLKGGTYSSYLGPTVATQFTTSGTLNPPITAPSLESEERRGYTNIRASWGNSGEEGVSTDVELAGPSASTPASSQYVVESSPAEPISSANLSAFSTGRYWVRIRHTKTGFTESPYAGPTSIDITVTGDQE